MTRPLHVARAADPWIKFARALRIDRGANLVAAGRAGREATTLESRRQDGSGPACGETGERSPRVGLPTQLAQRRYACGLGFFVQRARPDGAIVAIQKSESAIRLACTESRMHFAKQVELGRKVIRHGWPPRRNTQVGRWCGCTLFDPVRAVAKRCLYERGWRGDG